MKSKQSRQDRRTFLRTGTVDTDTSVKRFREIENSTLLRFSRAAATHHSYPETMG